MPFCMQCGQPTELKIPEGDQKARAVCTQCAHIHYENPKIICGALITHEHKVLMCRRAIEPRYGFWTLPAGFMELGETMQAGAARESWEEAEAHLNHATLYCLYDIPSIGQLYALYKAELTDGTFGAGAESLECALFAEDDIPWGQTGFPQY